MAKIVLKKSNRTESKGKDGKEKVIKKKVTPASEVKIKMKKATPAGGALHTSILSLKKGGKIKIEAIKNPNVKLGRSSQTTKKENHGDWTCSVSNNSIESTSMDAFILNTQFDDIYVGAIYDFESIANGSYKVVPYARKPMNIVTSATATSLPSVIVDSPNSSTVTSAVTKIIGKIKKFDSASFAIKEKINSEEEWYFKTAGSGYYLGFGGSHDINFKTVEKSNKYFAQYAQVYFNVSVSDSYDKATEFFLMEGEGKGDLDYPPMIDPDWVVVKSVTYGRLLNIIYESDYSFEEVGIEANMYANVIFAGIDLTFNDRQKRVMEKTKMTVMTVGGDAIYSGLLHNSTSQKDMIKRVDNYLKNLGTPAKIGYSLKTLDGAVVGTRLITDYASRVCSLRASKYRVTWQHVVNSVNDDAGNAEEIKAFVRIAAFNGKGKMILDVDKKNKEIEAWNNMPSTAQKFKPKPWTFTVGSASNPLELADGQSWAVGKSIEFEIPIDDDKAKIAIRTDVREFDDFDDDNFAENYWERKVSELSGSEDVKLTCRHDASRMTFLLKVEPVF